MKVRVKTFGSLRDRLGASEWSDVVLGYGATVHNLLAKLEINDDEVMTVLKNGVYCEMDYVICENDEYVLVPPIFAG